MVKSVTEIRFLIAELQVVSAFDLESSLRVFNCDLKKSLKILEKIIVNLNSNLIKILPERDILIQISCFLFQSLSIQRKKHWFRKNKKLDKIESCLVRFFLQFPEEIKPSVVTNIIQYLNDNNSWHLEYISSRLFRILLSCSFNSELILSSLSSQIEILVDAELSEKAIEIGLILHQILTLETCWKDTKFTDVTSLLRMYHTTVTNKEKIGQTEISSCLEICLQSLFRVIPLTELLEIVIIMITLALDTTSSVCIPFGNLSLTSVICYLNNGNFSDFPPFLLEYIIEAVASPEPSKSYLACKILARFFDDKQNYNEFLFPKIFHSYMSYNVKLSTPVNDKELLSILTYQKSIYQALLQSIKQHNNNKRNLNAIYNTICTIIVKVLTGTEAATVVCLLMDMQNFFLDLKVGQKIKNYGHGLVLSLMSLYCWIYRGKPLLTYVENLISKRFAEAQHLLPPSSAVQGPDIWMSFKSQSNQNIIKKNLFFDNLELRYALWKCFVTKENVMNVSQVKQILTEHSLIKEGNSKTFLLQLDLTKIE